MAFIFLSLEDLGPGAVQIGVSDGTDTVWEDLPALETYKYTRCFIEFTPTTESASFGADASAITDIYLRTTESVSTSFAIIGMNPMIALYQYGYGADKEWYFPINTQVNSLIEYAGGSGEVYARPWMFTWKGPWYLEGENWVKLYLQELEELEHPDNGKGVCVNGPYLYFNVAEKIQRYYAGQLDDIGPDRDYGLPKDRRGIPLAAASYPGTVIYGFDAGADGYSHVMCRRHHGWHEIYRSPVVGERIRAIHSYARADKVDEIYVLEGADILCIPIDLAPETRDGYEFTWHGHIETPRIYATTRETSKFFKSLELIQELHEDAPDTPLQAFRVYYKTNSTDDYTLIGNYLEQSADHDEEKNIGSYDVGGNWIQFLVEFETQDVSYSPILVAMVLSATERLVVKNTYTYNLQIREGYDDLLDSGIDTVDGKTKIDRLDAWAAQELPLILSSNSIFEDQKRVFIEPTRSKFTHGGQDGDGNEVRTYQLTLLEV